MSETPKPQVRTVAEELAARCESATGPDRELDCLIELACGPDGRAIQRVMDGSPHNTVHEVAKAADREDGALFFRVPAYTASLDAAMGLIPAGHAWECGTDSDGTTGATCSPRGDDMGEASLAATPALALTAAALRARALTMTPEKGGAK